MDCKDWEDEAAAALPSLPGLRADELATKGRAFYRNRQYTELEPARCYGAVCSGAGPPEAFVRLRSLSSANRTVVWFRNHSTTPVHLIWITYDGDEMSYGRLDPNGTAELLTFGNHPWVFRDIVSRRRMSCLAGASNRQVYFPGSDPLNDLPGRSSGLALPPIVVIKQPPLVRWSQESHKVFPRAFKKSTVAFLSCHTRLSARNARRRTRSEVACNLGDLPAHLVAGILVSCAPEVWQQSSCPHPEGRADLGPAMVPCSPAVFESLKPAVIAGHQMEMNST